MRPELKEYNFDWMLWATTEIAYKTLRGTEKEYKKMLNYMPYFRGLLDLFVLYGEPGIKFLELIKTVLSNIINAHDNGKKLGMTTFCFSPIIFYAMDIVPVILEPLTVLPTVLWKRGTFDYMDYCFELGFTETSCSSQRGSLGAYLANLCEQVDFIVVDSGGICDTNANSFAFASSYLKKPMYHMDYPADLVSQKAKQYHREDFKKLIEFLEYQTGKKLDISKLRSVLKETIKQDIILSELEELQMIKPNPLPVIYNLFIYAGRFFSTGTPEYTELLQAMLNIAKENARSGKSGIIGLNEKCRAFFCYIDHYTADARMWKWLDQHGIAHIGCILSRFYSDRSPYIVDEEEAYKIETASLDSMIDSISEINARSPMVRTIRGPYDAPHMWLDDSIKLAKLFQADCVVYNGTPGCRNTWGMVKPFARDVEKAGFPTLIMYSDAFDDRVQSWEATTERLDEFFKIRRLI